MILRQIKSLLSFSQNNSSLRRHLTKSAIGSFVLKVSATALLFLTTLILARILGAKGYGAYAYAISLIGLFNILVLFGLPMLATREISVYNTHSKWEILKGFLRWSERFVFTNSLVVALIAFIITWILRQYFNHQMLLPFWMALFLLPVLSLLQLKEASIQGLKRILTGQISSTIIRPVLLLLTVGFLYLFKYSITPSIAVGINAIVTLIALLVAFFILVQSLPKPVKFAILEYKVSIWIKSAFPLLLSGALTLLNTQTDIIMLGAIKGAKAAGIYAVATRIATLIIFVLISVNSAIAPTIAELYSKKDLKRLKNIITKSARLTFFFSLPIAIFLIFWGRFPLWLFGKEFMGGSIALAILSIGQLISASTGSVGLILIMTGCEREFTLGAGISAVANIVLNATLIPFLDMNGAALATSTSMIIWSMISIIMIYKRLGIDPTILGIYNE